MADPDLQLRWEGRGGHHPDPEISGGGGGGLKEFFSAHRASVWSKNKGGRLPWASPLDPPLPTPLAPAVNKFPAIFFYHARSTDFEEKIEGL